MAEHTGSSGEDYGTVTRCALPPPALQGAALLKCAGLSAACGTCSRGHSGPFLPFPWNGQRPLVGTSSIMALVPWKGTDLTVPGRFPILALKDGSLKAPPGTECSWTPQRGADELHHQPLSATPDSTLALLSGRSRSSPPRITSLLPRDEPKRTTLAVICSASRPWFFSENPSLLHRDTPRPKFMTSAGTPFYFYLPGYIRNTHLWNG